MTQKLSELILLAIAIAFTIFFALIVMPHVVENPNILEFFTLGFVNPISSGYSMDTILCWVVLLVLVIYDAANYRIKNGWLCVLLGAVPGVAVGFALYLITRNRQMQNLGDCAS